jgi:hypothetical protein
MIKKRSSSTVATLTATTGVSTDAVTSNTATELVLKTTEANSATAFGVVSDTSSAYSDNSARLHTFRNNGTDKAWVSKDGSLIPATNAAGQNLGDPTHRWFHGYIYDLTDDNSVTRLAYGGGANGMTFTGVAPDGATAIGCEFNNNATLSTTGAKLWRWLNNGTEKLAVAYSGKFVYPASGAADVRGTATLSGGTVTVSTTAVKTGDVIMVSRNTTGGTAGHLNAPVASIVNSTSFVINSSSGTDTSTVNWWILT